VIELRSKTDRLKPLQEKMQEYLTAGLGLGWLINPQPIPAPSRRGKRETLNPVPPFLRGAGGITSLIFVTSNLGYYLLKSLESFINHEIIIFGIMYYS
jgi:Uma2 family endonuclease